jgi:tetratricopeptide (TPR) repeat protein
MVAFVAILALTTFGALATASAQQEEAKADGVTSPAVAQALHSRGLAAWREGKYSEAEGLYKRALTIREQALGTSHPDVARTLDNMAILYESRGESGSALAYSRKATAAVLAIELPNRRVLHRRGR